MQTITIIGDVHGKLKRYQEIIDKLEGKSIQLGDFGFKVEHKWHMKNIDSELHKISFGNHDSTRFLKKPHSLGDSSWNEDYKLMTVRGADSIDKYRRIEGVDWFADEELDFKEMLEVYDKYLINKPEIMVTHDCPHELRKELFNISDKSATSNGLQAMFEEHQPKIWLFGHHHKPKDIVINGTRFICLAELETFTI